MPMKSHDEMKTCRAPGRVRRGNAMVLVAGLLVLLVIIVAAFLTSSRGTRELASAQRERSLREASVGDIAQQLADEIAGALFARPIDATGIGNPIDQPSQAARELALAQLIDGNRPRVEPPLNARRYGTDWDADGDGFPDINWNTVPYHVVPWTNWPDNLSALGAYPAAEEQRWPAGPGFPANNPNPGIFIPGNADLQITEGNPIGDPGTNDTRWLADFEPMRWDNLGGEGVDGFPYAFRMWRHLSHIGRPGNGWRPVADISNVTGNLVENLRYPVEQWQIDVLPTPFVDPNTGYARWETLGTSGVPATPAQADNGASYGRWQDWFFRYPFVYAEPGAIPHNFFRLDDADADGNFDPPSDTFRFGTPRWDLNRVLDDADGDGFTDSMWWLAPIQGDDGVRYVASFRIVDNSAKVNANVATRFEPGQSVNPADDLATKGETPADVALVGRPTLAPLVGLPLVSDFNVGLLDNPLRRDSSGALLRDGQWSPTNPVNDLFDTRAGGVSDVSWGGNTNTDARNQWRDFINELRVPTDTVDDAFIFADDRRLYFNVAGSRPFDPGFGIVPFGVEDEVELRLFHGNNFTWAFSRFERALNRPFELDQAPFGQILRSSLTYQESSGYAGPGSFQQNFKLDAYELAHDTRRRLTLFNGARNDLKPGWLRWRGALPDRVYRLTRSLSPTDRGIELSRFFAQAARKMDLRENDAGRVLRGDGVSTDFRPRGPGERFLHERLAEEIFLALVETNRTGDVTVTGPADFESIFGTGRVEADNEELEKVQRVAAALSANILSSRDDDRPRMEIDIAERFNVAPLYDEVRATGQAGAIPLPPWPDNYTVDTSVNPPLEQPTFDTDRDRRLLGLEPQPFLTEAMVCLVHGGSLIVPPPAAFFPFVVLAADGGTGSGSIPTYAIARPSGGGGEEGTTVLAVQLANPFDHVIPWQELRKYGLRILGQDIPLERLFTASGYPDGWSFLPSADDNPVTLTIVIADESYSYQQVRRFNGDAGGPPTEVADFRTQWLEFLGLRATTPGGLGVTEDSATLVVPWSVISGLSGDPEEFYVIEPEDGDGGGGGIGGGPTTGSDEAIIELFRLTFHDRADVRADSENVPPFDAASLSPGDPNLVDRVVVDRFGLPGSSFHTQIAELQSPPEFDVEPIANDGINSGPSEWAGIRSPSPIFMQPVTVRRAWSRDLDVIGVLTAPVDVELIGFSPREHGPRYVFADDRVFGPSRYQQPADSGAGLQGKTLYPGDDGDSESYRGWDVDMANPTDDWDSPLPLPSLPAGVGTASEYEETWFWEFIDHPYRFDDTTTLPNPESGQLPQVARRPTYFDGARDPFSPDRDFLFTAAEEGAGQPLPVETRQLLGRGLWKGDFGVMEAPFQMLQKEGDFQQVGELMLVFGVGHELSFAADRYEGTLRTFSEAIVDRDVAPSNRGVFAGRLEPGRIIGDAPATARFDALDRRHSVPELAAGYRLLSAFVCDGPGVNWDALDPDSLPYDVVAFGNAAGFTGRATPGMVNINTAAPEVLAALPHWTTLTHFDGDDPTFGTSEGTTALPHAVLSYRERYDNFARALGAPSIPLASHGMPFGPDWTERPNDGRDERGFADIGELLQVDQQGSETYPRLADLSGAQLGGVTSVEDQLRAIRYLPDSWRISWAGREPFRRAGGSGWLADRWYGTRLGIDVNQPDRDLLRPPGSGGDIPAITDFLRREGDPAAGDAEERRMLFSGVSNIVTTTSDMFTVYFRVRAFRPREDGVLDATDPTAVLSDRRYVMLVDRSQVNTPTDKPRIVYLQEVPD